MRRVVDKGWIAPKGHIAREDMPRAGAAFAPFSPGFGALPIP
ncbi:hypothetical protein [Erythrobacter insulae]|nr:hypothetical protein [Erythrobacter insulae]